jgi:hypothetical protein
MPIGATMTQCLGSFIALFLLVYMALSCYRTDFAELTSAEETEKWYALELYMALCISWQAGGLCRRRALLRSVAPSIGVARLRSERWRPAMDLEEGGEEEEPTMSRRWAGAQFNVEVEDDGPVVARVVRDHLSARVFMRDGWETPY